MNHRSTSQKSSGPHVIIRVSGKLFQGHLHYLNQLVQSADECQLWPLLNLADLEELDRSALRYLIDGEDRNFGITSCPNFVRNSMEEERGGATAA